MSIGLDGQVRVWDGNTFAPHAAWKTQPYRFLAAALSHGGNRLAVGTDGDGILLGDLDSASASPIKLGGSQRITSVAFSEDDRWLLAGKGGGQILYWDLVSPDRNRARSIGPSRSGNGTAVWRRPPCLGGS